MNLWLRLIWAYLSYRSRSKLQMHSVAVRSFRIWPSDLDIFNHMNNGKFLSLLDLGRFDLLLRSGIWPQLRKRRWYPVVVAETITFRKSLKLWQKFEIESAVGGWDEEAVYIDQRFVVNGEIYAQAWVRVRYLVNPRGIVTPAEVIEAFGPWPKPKPELPKWVEQWGEASKLPKGKEPAESNWPKWR